MKKKVNNLKNEKKVNKSKNEKKDLSLLFFIL